MIQLHEIRKKVKQFQKGHQSTKSIGEVFASPKLTYFMAVFTLVSVLFLMNSNRLLGSQLPLEDSGIGDISTQSLNGDAVSILSHSQSTSSEYVELIVQTSATSSYVPHTYEVASIAQPSGTKVGTSIAHLYGNYYVIQIEELPNNWQEIVLVLGYLDDETTEEKVQEITFHYYKQNVPVSPNTAPQSLDTYIVHMTTIEEKMIAEQMTESQEKIEAYQQKIADITDQIYQNESDVTYQVGEEKRESEAVISRLHGQMQDTEKLITAEQEVIANYQEQLTLIEQRRTDLNS